MDNNNVMDPGCVHVACRHGAGRTGAFLAVDATLEQVAGDKSVDIFSFVLYLRTCRQNMVRTLVSYGHNSVSQMGHRWANIGPTAKKSSGGPPVAQQQNSTNSPPVGQQQKNVVLERTFNSSNVYL